LREHDHLYEAAPSVDTSLNLSGWTGGSVGDQAAALLSLALGRRVRGGGVVRQRFEPGDPAGRPTAPEHRVPSLVEPGPRGPLLPGINEAAMVQTTGGLFDGYARLSAIDAAALTRAAAQYADALWWADADPRISWIKLVGALEAAANRADMAASDDEPVALLKRIAAASTAGSSGSTARPPASPPRTWRACSRRRRSCWRSRLATPRTRRRSGPTARGLTSTTWSPRCGWSTSGGPGTCTTAYRSPQPLCEPPVRSGDGICERFPALGVQAEGGTWPAEQAADVLARVRAHRRRSASQLVARHRSRTGRGRQLTGRERRTPPPAASCDRAGRAGARGETRPHSGRLLVCRPIVVNVEASRYVAARPSPHRAFGTAVRALRERHALSQEELAARAGVHRNYLGGIERGERNPTLTNVIHIAEALDTRPSKLLADAGL
jgi:DNA-binding XRE family transcriptional regulator